MHSPHPAARLQPATGETPHFITGPNGTKLAYIYSPAAAAGHPAIVFLPGYKSDMMGSKATFLAARCAQQGIGCLRLDYSAHGASGGDFRDYTLSHWLADAAFLIRGLDRPCILVGSSMGGWLGLRLCEQYPDQVAAFIGIAAAPDFTHDITASMTETHKAQMAAQGYITEDNAYSDEPYIFTRALIEDGETHCMLDRPIAYAGPVHLLQGMKDTDVHWRKALLIHKRLKTCDVTLIEDGTHTLSRPRDLDILWAAIAPFIGKPATSGHMDDAITARIHLAIPAETAVQ